MLESVRQRYEAFPEPSPAVVPIGPGQLDRLDDNLHFGWSWSRHVYCYRRTEGLRVLDAGCGTGLTTLGLARLNPGSHVLGVDATPRALELARSRAAASAPAEVEFRAHDLDDPLPAAWGPFDFIVCRGVLAESGDPTRVLKNLATVLDHRGLLHVTLPAQVGHVPVRQMRQAVLTIAPPGSSLEQKAELGLELFRVLRPDHPIRRYEEAYSGKAVPSVARFVTGYLNEDERDWSLPQAIALLESAGFRFLFAATRAPWRADRALAGGAVPATLKARVDGLGPRGLACLVDALDPLLHADEYRVYACLAEYEPQVPAWTEESRSEPAAVGRLIPHRTHLAEPVTPQAPSPQAKVAYRVVTGAVGEVAQLSHLMVAHIDDARSCEQIDALVAEATGVTESPEERQKRWLELAGTGFVLFEPPDRRQYVDCVHLGPVLDRLDCACPRRWVHACEIHRHCTLAAVPPQDEKHVALAQALTRLGTARAAACAACPDYAPEE
ncbi:MAG: class I SAM-dependent methyltransferase [Isosphaeraceae bacterium]|nr:class I SAM-dependent methyltransferase [Isosphaeraceae bacterium]